ncbi:hypothetical protein chiPu_0014439 [Chiloscyllium punctatum]|uniref:EF-hand domain-containing protein n=1 Tax=Chiloscyllium punctatum TaxID=137246 RepID=A0A401SZX2_CHIPU|nr:hypothetical protein [Chiloscyllium punctatum]
MAPKKAKKKLEGGSSNVFSMFDQTQIQELKETRRPVFKSNLTTSADPEETILNAFKIFDPEAKGHIKADYIKQMLTTQADRFNEEECEQMFTAFPPDVAGNLDYKNLCYVITHGEEKD